jgi:branched-chain amino acid transport system ATP-binding protein
MPDALELEGVCAGYGPTVILEDIAFTIPASGSLAVLGRNGVGKTTLLATIMGLTTLQAGSIRWRGESLTTLPVHQRARLGIGYVPQTRDIFPSLSVEENLAVAARAGRWSLERVYDLFPRLSERRTNMGNQISGGEQQMLAIGRALMGGPSLLLLDEPLEGLAPIIVDALLAAIKRLAGEEALSIILVEQSAKLALEVTERAVVLNRGRLAFQGNSAQLLENPDLLSSLVVSA